MTASTDLHPEELLVEREVQGEKLGGRERQALDEHVRSCDPCRFIRLAASDFAREVPADAGPPPQLERLIQTALWSMRPPEASHARARWRAPRAVAATVTLCAAGFAAAHLAGMLPHRHGPPAERRDAIALGSARTPPAAPRAPDPEATEESATHPESSGAPEPLPPLRAPAKARAAAGRPWEELFSRATVARAQGRTQQALRLYDELARTYPRSPEGTAAFAFKARLELDRGQARAAAGDFDRYLARGAGGSLEEEALVGRAEAFRILERPAQERADWMLLLRRFPGSAHARRAEARLAELRSQP